MMMIGELQEVEEKTPFTHRVFSTAAPLSRLDRWLLECAKQLLLHKQNDMPLQPIQPQIKV